MMRFGADFNKRDLVTVQLLIFFIYYYYLELCFILKTSTWEVQKL